VENIIEDLTTAAEPCPDAIGTSNRTGNGGHRSSNQNIKTRDKFTYRVLCKSS
jgi:hypothetical protein